MGVSIVIVTLLLVAVYFPDMGGMLVGAGGLPCYDPQIIKPPADYRGADSMDYGKVASAPLVAASTSSSVAASVSSTTEPTRQNKI